ncbi:MAG: methyltransferase domain-containing protein [Verrucomicrobia bacterium]|nr:methyltransferase domain-containing protein [Verrucomicrobiota bacterium]
MSHKEWVQKTFDAAAPLYADKSSPYFDYFGQRLVDLAQVSPTDRVLDVATGKGAVLLPVSQIAKQAVGIDLSAEMVKAARMRMPHAELHQMDAEKLIFADSSFDLVFCAFALFFMPHLSVALSEFKRVLKPTGRLAVSIWGEKNPLDAWVADRAEALGGTKQIRLASLNSAEALSSTLSGFNQIRIVEESKVFIKKSPEEWWDSLWGHGIRSQFEQLSPENLALLRSESLEQACKYCIEGTLPLKRQVFYGLCQS